MNTRFIKHKDITENKLNNIIELKDKVWPYGYTKQLDWIEKNVVENDIHVLCYEENILVSYLLLVPIEIEGKFKKRSGFGVSTVCSLEKGKGFGKAIMYLVNSKLIEENKFGLLFCHLKNLEFYQKCNWQIIRSSLLEFDVPSIDNIKTFGLVFNLDTNGIVFKYKGKLF